MEQGSDKTSFLKKDGRRLLITLVSVLVLMAAVVLVQQKFMLIERLVTVPEVKFNEAIVSEDSDGQEQPADIEVGEEELTE